MKGWKKDIFNNFIPRRPIHKRVSNNEIQLNLDNELRARNIETSFEYGVFKETRYYTYHTLYL